MFLGAQSGARAALGSIRLNCLDVCRRLSLRWLIACFTVMINANKILSEPRRNVVLTVLNYIIQYRFTYGLKCGEFR